MYNQQELPRRVKIIEPKALFSPHIQERHFGDPFKEKATFYSEVEPQVQGWLERIIQLTFILNLNFINNKYVSVVLLSVNPILALTMTK